MKASFVIKPMLSLVFAAMFLTACSDPEFKSEQKLPNEAETCGGSALKNKYIVRFKNGSWAHFTYSDREKFKNEIVVPQVDEIDFIEYDQRLHLHDFVSEAATPLWTARYNWGARAIGADTFWKKSIYGQGVIVAVVDSGVDIHHPQLSQQILRNSGEDGIDAFGDARSSNGKDDDGNGYIDDYLGYDFTTQSGDLTDEVAHGTHVAGIIAAQHQDTEISETYVQGVAPQTKILPIKFLSTEGGLMSDALKAIDYAVDRGAQIINASWGGTGCSLSLRQKVSDLSRKNILFVAAAGNSGSNLDRYPEFPAAFNLPFQITVGSITENLLPASHSNYSVNLVHIFAPGKDIISTIPNGRVAPYEGTSMAAPFVSAAAALILSNAPHLAVSELRDQILQSVQEDQDFLNQTRGRLDLTSAP